MKPVGLLRWYWQARVFLFEHTFGRCAYCQRWGWVYRDDHLHERCWLELK